MRSAVAILVASLGVTACAADDSTDDTTSDADDADDATDEVTDDAPGPSEVVLTLHDSNRDSTSNATLVAFQDGDDAWVAITGEDGVYRATATGARYGFVIICATTGATSRTTYYATVAESSALDGASCAGATATRTLTGTVRGPSTLSNPSVTTVGGSWTSNALGAYSLMTIPGTVDVLTTAHRNDGARVMARTQASGSTLDIDLTNAAIAAQRPLDVTGMVVGESFFAQSWIQTPAGILGLSNDSQPRYLELPSSLSRPGDVVVFAAGSSRMEGAQAVSRYAKGTSPALALPAAVTFTKPDANLAVGLPPLGAADGISVLLVGTGITSFQYATTGWLGAATTLTLVDPDGVAGWQPNWNQPVAWTRWTATWSRGEGTTYESSTTSGPR